MARSGRVSRRGRTPAEDKRPVRPQRYQYLFLIICEDEATEPAYFDSFLALIPPKTIYLRVVGTGRDPLGVVEQAQLRRDELQAEVGRGVDEVWVVFDKDDADAEEGKITRFNQAEQLATREQFKLAFSNEVFELWLLLHFTEVAATPPMSRRQVYEKLGEAIQQHDAYREYQYNHQQAAGEEIVRIVQQAGNEELAIQRAEALLASHNNKTLLETNPSTRVHLLVRSLRSWIAYYGYQS